LLSSLSKLVSGSLLAQVISFVSMPLITRIYSPESLGFYQFFTTVCLVLVPIVSGSLPFAVKSSSTMLRAKKNMRVGIFYIIVATLILFLTAPVIIFSIKDTSLSWFIGFVPLVIVFCFFSSIFQLLLAYSVNLRNYNKISLYTASKSLLSNFLKITFSGLSKSGLSLIWAIVLTEIIQVYSLSRQSFSIYFGKFFKFNRKVMLRELYKLRDYPTYISFSSVITILMNWYPILITGVLYGPEYAGYLGLAFMVVNTPIYPFINALQSMCFGELARARDKINFFRVYGISVIVAFSISLMGFCILGLYGEELFNIVFGATWETAGSYAFICFFPISAAFIFSPIYSTLNHFYGFQRVFFKVQFSVLLLGVGVTLYIGASDFPFLDFITWFSVIMSVNHIALMAVALYLVRKRMFND